MTGGDARRGRRDNGLSAAHYCAAGDVDPRVGEHLLDVLALQGIAAYLRPTADINPLTRSSVLPNRPTDRLYVDETHLATARDYLTRLAADAADDVPPDDREPADPLSDDDVWAGIVAAYESEPAVRSWPAAEDLAGSDSAPARTPMTPTGTEEPPAPPVSDRRDGTQPPAPPPTTDTTEPSSRGGWSPGQESGPGWAESGGRPSWETPAADPENPSLLDGLDTFGADLGDEEGFTPPAPPPIPRPSLPTALGVVGVVGGLIVFLRPDLLPFESSAAMIIGFTVLVAGFVTLVWRLRPGDDEEDGDPDDGARV